MGNAISFAKVTVKQPARARVLAGLNSPGKAEMDLVSEKLLDLLSEKVSKKAFIVALVIVGIVNFDISAGIVIPVLKSAWCAILLTILLWGITALLIKTSHKKGRRSYSERRYADYQSIVQNSDIRLEVNMNRERYLFGLEPERQILLFNRQDQTIKAIKGYIDFLKASSKKVEDHSLCVERIPFETNHLRPHEGFVIQTDVGFNISEEWNYISVWLESLETEKSIQRDVEFQNKMICHIPDLEGLLASNCDLRWLKEKFRKFFSLVRFYWCRQFYSNGDKTYRAEERKEFFRICVSRLVITILAAILFLVVLGIAAVIVKGIIDVFIIHVKYLVQRI